MSENVQQKTASINDILKMVSRANETFVYEIYVPSLGKKLMFREINTSQQKRLIKSIIDSPAFQTEFIFALRQIIKENCVDEGINVGSFNIFDKMVIAMTMRAMSISNDLDLQFQEDDNATPIKIRINLKDLVDKAVKDIHVEPAIIKDDQNVFEIMCSLPTIDDEFNLESELRSNVKSIEIKGENELRQTVGEVFTNEIVKYIKQVNIKNKDTNEIIELDLKNLKFTDRLAILNKIPAKVNNKIIQYINSVNKEFEKILLFSQEKDGKKMEQRLRIDASFFTVS